MGKREINNKANSAGKPDPVYSFMILLYAVVPVIMPDFGALDSNGPKFLMLAVLNLFSYLYISVSKDSPAKSPSPGSFILSLPGSAYVIFLLISLFSFTRSINIPESILQFSKSITVFFSVFVLYLLFKKDRRYFTQLAIILTIILFIDCLTVFYNIFRYIDGKLPGIIAITSVYSNKNILASAIFVKIPFALWLLTYEKGRWRSFGLVVLFFAFTVTFLMSTRAFYIGLIVLTVAFIATMIMKFIRGGEKILKFTLAGYLLALTMAFLSYSLVQKVFYPKKQDIYNVTVAERISSISPADTSASTRIMAWKNSLKLIRENPLLGIGPGNWKIMDIKFENQVFPTYIYMYKCHNDFLETTAETGIFGGLAFLCLFLFIPLDFLKTLFGKPAVSNLKFLFIPFFGLLCYSIDAFFNFPADRPEIQMLFALFIASGICFRNQGNEKKYFSGKPRLLFSILIAILMPVPIYILANNVVSLRYQRIAWQESQQGKLVTSSSVMMNCFPAVPGIGAYGEAISTVKASYLLEEGKYNEMIDYLKNDHTSPFDTRRENLIGRAYSRSGRLDSALIYFKNAHDRKPLLFSMVKEICDISMFKGDSQTAIKCIHSYLGKVKDNPAAWNKASIIYEQSNNLEMSLAMIDSSVQYLPNDSGLLSRKIYLQDKVNLTGLEKIYQEGVSQFDERNYPDAIKNFTEIIDKNQKVTPAYEYRSKCYFFLGNFEKTISDLNVLITRTKEAGNLYNIRGICQHNLGNDTEACNDFDVARKMGVAGAEENFNRFCLKK